MKGCKRIFQANGKEKRARLAIFISDNIDVDLKSSKRDEEGHNIMIKEYIQQEENTTNVHAPNARASKHETNISPKRKNRFQ